MSPNKWPMFLVPTFLLFLFDTFANNFIIHSSLGAMVFCPCVVTGAQKNTNITSIMPVLLPRLYLKDAHENNQTIIFFHSSTFTQFIFWACIQSGKQFCIRRHDKGISRINHLSYILPKSLNMTWRSTEKLSKHSLNMTWFYYIEIKKVTNT